MAHPERGLLAVGLAQDLGYQASYLRAAGRLLPHLGAWHLILPLAPREVSSPFWALSPSPADRNRPESQVQSVRWSCCGTTPLQCAGEQGQASL